MKKLFFLLIILILAVSCENKATHSGSDSGYTDIEVTDEETENDGTSKDDSITTDNENPDTATDDIAVDNTTDIPDEDMVVETIDYESGFIYLPVNNYSLDGNNLQSGAAGMWYSFQPADENPEEKPLFVFFNGGPGSATMLLFCYNTAKMTADQKYSDIDITANPDNWNQIGNLLYLDARQTGFSYGIVNDPSNKNSRSSEFATRNFNVFVDASDFIRTILTFLNNHPVIKSNEVVIVGESYGGTRATAMLNILQNVRDYADGNRNFFDHGLFDMIDSHFMDINPEMSALPSKETIKEQFSSQILIQPLIMGEDQFNESGELLEQPGSPMYEVESETGVDYKPCSEVLFGCEPHNNVLSYLQKAGRDIYSYRRPAGWLFDYSDIGAEKLVQYELFKKLIKNDPLQIDGLFASNRDQAFRYEDASLTKFQTEQLIDMSKIPELVKTEVNYRESRIQPLYSSNFDNTYGILEPWDEFFIDLQSKVNYLFYMASTTPYDDVNSWMFLENIRDTKTFITNAEEDMIIYSKGIPLTVAIYDSVENVTEGDESFTVDFKDGKTVTVTWPFYLESSHSVSINQPEKFLNDVKKWLE